MRESLERQSSERKERRRHGTTVLETLVVMGCFSMLLASAANPVFQAREAAKRSQCKNNLKQIALAMHNNHDVDRFFPPGSTDRASWAAYILPFIDQNPIYQRIDPRNGAQPVVDPATITLYLCPGNPPASRRNGATTYLGCAGTQDPQAPPEATKRGVFRDESLDAMGHWKTGADPAAVTYPGWSYRGNYFRFRDNTDGTSSTLMIGETAHADTFWCPSYDPRRNHTLAWMDGTGEALMINAIVDQGPPVKKALFSSWHDGGAQFGAVDGSVHFLSDRIDPEQFGSFLTIRGGEVSDLPN